jgi:hypothetical protein
MLTEDVREQESEESSWAEERGSKQQRNKQIKNREIVGSCSTQEHKHSAIRYMINRMNTYPISTENKHKEIQLINTILHSNGYPPQIHIHKKRQTINTTSNITQKQK